MRHKISILIPTYNRNALLQALEGVRGQRNDDLEVLVLDDASNPPAADACRDFSDLPLRVVRFDTNVHVSAMHEKVLDGISGDLMYILEDDNGLVPGALDCVDDLFGTVPEMVMLGTGFVLYEHGSGSLLPMNGKQQFSGGLDRFDSREYMLKNLAYCGIGNQDQYRQPPMNHVSATFVSVPFLKEHRRSQGPVFMKPAGDYRLRFHVAAGTFHYLDKPLAYVGTHPGQATNVSRKNSRLRLLSSSWARDYTIQHSPLRKGITFNNISADWVLGDAFELGLLRPGPGLLQPSFFAAHLRSILTDSPWTTRTVRDLLEALPQAGLSWALNPPLRRWARQFAKLLTRPGTVFHNRFARQEVEPLAWPVGVDAIEAAQWVRDNLWHMSANAAATGAST